MYNIAVIDDDIQELKIIEEKITELFLLNQLNVSIVTFDNPIDVDKSVNYDVLFLDIDMPFLDGIEFAKTYQSLHSDVIIIFITNHSDMVFNVFTVHPFDFIKKERFYLDIELTVNHVISKLKKEKQLFSFKAKQSAVTIRVDDIMYCEYSNRGVTIFLERSNYRTNMKLSTIASTINSPALYKIRSSFLVNWKYVSSINAGWVFFNNGHRMQISKLKLKGALDSFNKYIARNL